MDDDQINRVYHGEIFTEEGQRRSRERIHWLVENAQGKTVLDVGCSQGITSILLGRKGFTCLGVDIAPPQIEYARRELEKEEPDVRQRVRFELLDGRAVGGGPYDTIILGQVLEHDPDPAGLLDALVPLMSKDGRLVVSVPYGYQPSDDHQRSVFIGDLLDLLSPRLNIEDIRVVNRFLVAVASEPPSDQAFRFDRRVVAMIEDLFGEVQHEIYDVKEKLSTRGEEMHKVKDRLVAKTDELQAAKTKLEERQQEIRHLRSKLHERAEDVRRLKERIAKLKESSSSQGVTGRRLRRWASRFRGVDK